MPIERNSHIKPKYKSNKKTTNTQSMQCNVFGNDWSVSEVTDAREIAKRKREQRKGEHKNFFNLLYLNEEQVFAR